MSLTTVPEAGSTPSTTPTPPAEPASSRRDAYFDNAKFLLIVLVVVGHALTQFLDTSAVLAAAYWWIYTLHMPAFVLIAGYFAKPRPLTDSRVHGLVTRVLAPYVIFQTLYEVFTWVGDGDPLDLTLIRPFWIMWFLLALFIWRVLAPYVIRLRHPVLMCLGLSLVSAMVARVDRDLTLDRVLGLLPFFALGLVLDRRAFAVLGRREVRVVAVGVLAAGAAAASYASARLSPGWLYWTEQYDALDVGAFAGVLGRLAMFGSALVMGAAFLALVPRRHTWFTGLGTASLYAYLLHGFVVLPLRWLEVERALTSPLAQAAYVLGAVVLATALCTRPVRHVFRPLVEPTVAWLFRPSLSADAASPRPATASTAAGAR